MYLETALLKVPIADLLTIPYDVKALPLEQPEPLIAVNCQSLTQELFRRRTRIFLPRRYFLSSELFGNHTEFQNIDPYDIRVGDIVLMGPNFLEDPKNLHQATIYSLPMDQEPFIIHARGHGSPKGVFIHSLVETQQNPHYQKIYAIKREGPLVQGH